MGKKPTKTKRGWMAGFMDGEGLITIGKQIRRNRPSPAFRAYAGACNTNRRVLEIFPEYYGGKIYRVNEKRTDEMGGKWADQYQWYCPISSTKRFLLDILPYLRLKKKQAILVLEFIQNKKAFARGKRMGRGGSSPLTQEEIDFRERLRRRVRLLNKKGKYARSGGGG